MTQKLTPEITAALKLPNATGALVADVEPGAPAAKAGLKPGDVIQGVGNRQVASLQDAVKAIQAPSDGKRQALALRVLRDGRSLFVAVPSAQG